MNALERSLGLPAVIAISLSSMLGSGIFVLPGLAATHAGSEIWLAYLIAAVCMIPAATSKAELATAMPSSGGTYVYLERIFGPLLGSIVGLGLWASMLFKSAFALLGFAIYLGVLTEVPARATALGLLAGIAALNVAGAKKIGKVQLVVVATTLVFLIVLALFAVPQMSLLRLESGAAISTGGLLSATGLVFISFDGLTKITAVAEEVRNPERTVPWGVMLSLALVSAIYVAMALFLLSVLGPGSLAGHTTPIHALASKVSSSTFGVPAAILGALTLVAMSNTGLLGASRFPFAMARERLLPQTLARVHPRLQTPVNSILLTASLMGLALALFDVERLAKLASSIVIGLNVAENVAVIVFRESRVQWYRPSFSTPFYPWLPGLGVVSGLLLLLTLGGTVALAFVVVTVPGVLIYLFYGRSRAQRRGVVGQRTKRSDLLQTARPTDADVGQAEAVVALFGGERSPEMLVEVGAALAESGTVQVAHLTEVPEQMALDVVLEEDVSVRSLRRRSHAAAEQLGAHLDFHAIVARDLVGAVHRVTSRTECHWLVMEWQGPSRKSLLPYNPIGWLINHLDANLALIRDLGIRYVREILVYPEPGPHDALVVRTAAHLAENWNAHVTLARFVAHDVDEAQVVEEQNYLDELELLVDGDVSKRILRGNDIVSTVNTETAAYDLLLMGQADASLLSTLRGTHHARIIKGSTCSVLSLKTPRFQTHASLRRHASAGESQRRLMPFITPGALQAKVRVHRKEDLFAHFGQIFEALFLGRVNARVIQDALWEREKTQNTSVGRGVALPHATVANIPSYIGVFTTRTPLDYGGADGKPVDVFFVTLCPPSDRNTHLELLRDIAALTLKTDLLDRLREAETAQAMREALEACCQVLDDADQKAREESVQSKLDTSVGTP